MGRTISVRLEDLPPLTAEQRDRLRRLAETPDEDIDFSDIPELTEADFARGVWKSGSLKKQVTVRLDPDVLAFFKQGGRGYQTRMNAVLRAYMTAMKRSAE